MVAEGGGGYPLGGPERAFVTRHLQQSSAGRPDLGREPPRRCGRVCWRARSPACCGAAASMPARSRATDLALLCSAAAPERRVRPARTVFSCICCHVWRSCPGSCDPLSTPASAPQTYTQQHCARFQGARDRTCRAYAKIVQLYQSRTRSSAAATAFLSPHFRFQDLTQYQE
jgi:hypothetical protein